MARVHKFAQKKYQIESEKIALYGKTLDDFTYNDQPVMGQGGGGHNKVTTQNTYSGTSNDACTINGDTQILQLQIAHQSNPGVIYDPPEEAEQVIWGNKRWDNGTSTFAGFLQVNGNAGFAGETYFDNTSNFNAAAVLNGPVELGGAVNLSGVMTLPSLSTPEADLRLNTLLCRNESEQTFCALDIRSDTSRVTIEGEVLGKTFATATVLNTPDIEPATTTNGIERGDNYVSLTRVGTYIFNILYTIGANSGLATDYQRIFTQFARLGDLTNLLGETQAIAGPRLAGFENNASCTFVYNKQGGGVENICLLCAGTTTSGANLDLNFGLMTITFISTF